MTDVVWFSLAACESEQLLLSLLGNLDSVLCELPVSVFGQLFSNVSVSSPIKWGSSSTYLVGVVKVYCLNAREAPCNTGSALAITAGLQAVAASSLLSLSGGWGQLRMKVPSRTGGRQEPAALGPRLRAKPGELKQGATPVGCFGVKNGADLEQ